MNANLHDRLVLASAPPGSLATSRQVHLGAAPEGARIQVPAATAKATFIDVQDIAGVAGPVTAAVTAQVMKAPRLPVIGAQPQA